MVAIECRHHPPLCTRRPRRHMQNAIKEGATVEEILEVIQLTSVMGIHACNLAVPILMEEMAAAGQPGKPARGLRRRGPASSPPPPTQRRMQSRSPSPTRASPRMQRAAHCAVLSLGE